MVTLTTERLILREWNEKDTPAFIDMNKDPKVMRNLLKILTAEESIAFLERITTHFKTHRFGYFACVLKETDECIGFIGLSIPSFKTAFTPCVEISWRLKSDYWNKGYATEGARAVLQFGFEVLDLETIVSYASKDNAPSRRVMEKLGLKHNVLGDFMHPNVPAGHRLCEHVLYCITKEEWQKVHSV